MSSYLPGIPAPFENESLASWIQRACQVYDFTFDRFHITFGTNRNVDIDLCMTPRDLRRVANMCRIPFSAFKNIEISFCRFVIQKRQQTLLFFQASGRPLYRFCPECWVQDKIPFLRLAWRLKSCLFCPVHKIPLPHQCPWCKAPLAMHRSILGGSAIPPPTPSIAICLHCGTDMRLYRPKNDTVKLDEKELTFSIACQQRLIAAIFYESARAKEIEEQRYMQSLLKFIDDALPPAAINQSTQIPESREEWNSEAFGCVVDDMCEKNDWYKQQHPLRVALAQTAFHLWQLLK